jgi:hypothetical protein
MRDLGAQMRTRHNDPDAVEKSTGKYANGR